MNEVNKKIKRNFNNNFYLLLICIATLFMSVGYASINSIVLDIGGLLQAQSQDGVFITDYEYVGSIDADYVNSKVIYAYQTALNSDIILSDTNANSSITYRITIYNSTSDDYVYTGENYLIDDGTYSNENIVFELYGLESGYILGSKKSVTFTITFYYKNGKLSESNILTSIINFDFEKFYYVTYENFSSTSGYPTYVVEGETLTISFGTLDAPIEVKEADIALSSGDYSYSNYTLTIDSIDGDIHIRKLTKYTMTNIVTNGSFENGFNGWTISGSSASWGIAQIPAYGSYSAYRVASAASSNFLMQSIYWISGHKYYYFGYASSVTTQSFVCNITNKGGKFTQETGPTAYAKGRVIYTADFTGYNNISINYAASTDNINVDGIGIVDLTASFGSGNEPSLSWCNANINYFDGSKTVYK